MKIYARQVEHENQISPLFYEGNFPDNIAVCGNRNYSSHTPEIFDTVINVLQQGGLARVLEYPKKWEDWYKNATQAITDYLPEENGKRYSTNAIHALRNLIISYSYCSKKEEDEIICKVLSIVTGRKWSHSIIRGSCQDDWQNVYYPVDEWDDRGLKIFETLYFNEGTDWIIHDSDTEPESPEEISGYSVYCSSWNIDDIKKEISIIVSGEDDVEVVLYEFNGYERTPIYRKG